MSGPKVSSYELERRAEAARRRLAEAVATAEHLTRRVGDLNADIRALRSKGVTDLREVNVELAPSGGVESIEAWNAATRSRFDAVDGALRRSRNEIWAVELIQVLTEGRDSGPAARLEVERAVGAEERAGASAVELAASLLGKLHRDATDLEREAVAEAAQLVSDATPGQRATRLTDLRARIQLVAKAAEGRSHDAERAEALLATLAGLSGSQVGWARSLLEKVMARETPLLEADVARIREIESEARRRSEDQFVAEVLSDALLGLGYELGPGFATALTSDQPVYAAHERWADHAVELTFSRGRVVTRVVRSGSTTSEADVAAERAFCADFGHLTAEAHEHGVEMGLDSYQPPGAVEVAAVDRAAIPRRASRRQDRAREARP